ncbi:MAG: SRPBCC family protein, partial [Myxococcota bacterium]
RRNASSIRCSYHGRCFDRRGRVTRSPGFETPETLEPLPSVAVGRWGPLVFASLNGDLPFERWLAGPLERLEFLQMDTWRFTERTVYDVDAHWSLYVENYLEGLHIPFVHPGLARTVDWRSYHHVLHAQGNLQIAEQSTTPTGPVFCLPDDHPDAGRPVSAYYFWLFPTTMLNIYPWGLSLNIVEPLGRDRTRVVFESFVGDSSLRSQGAGSALDEVEREDEAVVASVHRGMQSHLFRPGRLSSPHEACVEQFRRLLGGTKVDP